ncbi:MAG: hypothetical protein HY934_00500 [Candidatus Firestonebacteria bacterium]|nr:hypothetical protein [Candidatus Firestonebacteria bacterium]
MINENEFEKFLSDVADPFHFWVASGERLKNLEELVNALEKMSDDIFAHHVNENKNDFSCWIRDCIGDKVLAAAIISIPVKTHTVKKIKDRIQELKKVKKTKSVEKKINSVPKKPAAKSSVKTGQNNKKKNK